MADDVDVDRGLQQKVFKSCFIHFKDVSQSLTRITEKRLLKLLSCRKRWIKFEEEEKAEIC